MALYEHEIEFLDVNGEKGTEQIFADVGENNPLGNPIYPTIQACSLAQVIKVTNRLVDTATYGTSGAGPYDDAEDKLVIECIEAGSGASVKNEFPGPKLDCFLGDQETIDTTFCAPLISWLETDGKGPNGGALTFLRGFRSRVRTYKGG